MCHFLTATMAPRGDEDAVRALAESFGLQWVLFENPNVKRMALNEGERYYQTTFSAACNCGTLIGILDAFESREKTDELRISQQVDKKRKQGWSETKIRRWVEEARASRQSPADQAEVQSRQPDSEISRWLDFLKGVATGHHASWIGILKHWYGGHLETERFEKVATEWIPMGNLDRSTLLHLKDDVLYRFQLTTPTGVRHPSQVEAVTPPG